MNLPKWVTNLRFETSAESKIKIDSAGSFETRFSKKWFVTQNYILEDISSKINFRLGRCYWRIMLWQKTMVTFWYCWWQIRPFLSEHVTIVSDNLSLRSLNSFNNIWKLSPSSCHQNHATWTVGFPSNKICHPMMERFLITIKNPHPMRSTILT